MREWQPDSNRGKAYEQGLVTFALGLQVLDGSGSPHKAFCEISPVGVIGLKNYYEK